MPEQKKFFVICQDIRSLFNVGSIFRTADAFGADKIYLAGITGKPPRNEISKVALGAENYIPWEHARQASRLIRRLKKENIRIVALEQSKGSRNLSAFKPRFPLALVIGNEPGGLPARILKLCDEIIEIKMYGKKESLNVGVAFGIAAKHISDFKNKT